MATVDVGASSYPSFIELDAADEYLAADIVRAAPWSLLNSDAKGRALASATRLLLSLTWCETAPDPDVDQASPVPEVTAMLAADLAAKPALFSDASGNSNVKIAKAGSAQVEFFAPVEGGPPLPKALWGMLLNAGLVCLPGSGDGSVLDGAMPFGTSDCVRPLGGRYPWDWPIAAADYD